MSSIARISVSEPTQNDGTLGFNTIVEGDCQDILRGYPADSIDLIVTSPPYADQRKRSYGGIRPDEYVDWFLPKADEFFRVLKPEGTFILNIKEPAVSGERHTYVIELILEMRARGWLWTEEFVWHKKNSYPGKAQPIPKQLGAPASIQQATSIQNVPRCRDGPGRKLGQTSACQFERD